MNRKALKKTKIRKKNSKTLEQPKIIMHVSVVKVRKKRPSVKERL